MSPTIDMPEPMQERVPAFVGSNVAGGCSTTECCCCAVLPTTSAAFATAFFSLSVAKYAWHLPLYRQLPRERRSSIWQNEPNFNFS
jgi:hypothetical protein